MLHIRDELVNPPAAMQVVNIILERNNLLETTPKIGTPLSSIVSIDSDYRFLAAKSYVSFYRFVSGDNTCFIDRILYSKRDCISILFGETISQNKSDEPGEEF
jgi:plasmid stabilization system protein ParE